MNEPDVRITTPGSPPSGPEIAEWLGEEAFEHWTNLARTIERDYPNTFLPQWLFGGRKHGWSLRYKKGKSFCTLIPERKHCAVLIVFGKEERERVESIRDRLCEQTLKEYDAATTYHDGRWVLLTVDSPRVIEDVRLLLSVKRKKAREEERGRMNGE